MSEPKPLLQSMDDAACELLKLIVRPEPGEVEGIIDRANPSEMVKIFEAVTDYIKWREKPAGTAVPSKSKFQKMREEFNGRGDKTTGRRSRAGADNSAGAEDGEAAADLTSTH